jgi:SulP family sulfate permease
MTDDTAPRRFNLSRFTTPKTFTEDLSAGIVLGIQSVPDGMASALLAMVNPVYGLYAYMVGTFTGALFTSSALMSVQATGAMSLIVASVPQVVVGENRSLYLFALSILVGVFMLIAGLLKLGKAVRFVPNAVMTGFISAIAINIILSQLGDFTGYYSEAALPFISGRIPRTIDLLLNLDQMHLPTLAVGVMTIVLIITLERTRLGALGLVVAMLATSLLVILVGAENVRVVNDIATIPSTLPRPVFPPLFTFLPLIVPAISLAFVGLVQGAAISQNFVNPDGSYPDTSRDFVGQGLANIVVGVFQGMPVGGSMSATAIVTNAGARTRLANIIAGLTMAVVILLFSRLVGLLAMPALAGLLIVIGFRTLKPNQIRTVWKTGPTQRVTMLFTFIASLLIPLQYAVLIGVGLAVILYVFRQSNQVTVMEWQRPSDRYPLEVAAPAVVPSDAVTILVPYGSLFFATASLFTDRLPQITPDTRRAVVILNLRRNTELGSTFLDAIDRYARKLHAQDSKLVLSGVDPQLKEQLEQTGKIDLIGRENIYMQTEYIGQSMENAYIDAQRWVAERQPVAAP